MPGIEPYFLPTPEEIARDAELIRSEWPPREAAKRAGCHASKPIEIRSYSYDRESLDRPLKG